MKRFRLLLAAALAAVLVGTLIAYWVNPPAKMPLVTDDPTAALLDEDGRPLVRGLTYTQVKDGAKKWTLSAKGARYDDASGHIQLAKPRVEYFPARGGLLTIRGDEGEYDQHNQVVVLRGRVQGATHDGMTLKAEYLTYSEHDQVVQSDSWVTLAGPRFKVTGKGVVASFPQETIRFQSQVDSTFIPAGSGPPPGATVDAPQPQPASGGKR